MSEELKPCPLCLVDKGEHVWDCPNKPARRNVAGRNAPVQVPEGWKFTRNPKAAPFKELFINGPEGQKYVVSNVSTGAELLLYKLAEDMLAAAPSAPAAYDLASGNDYSATWDVSKAAPAARESGAREECRLCGGDGKAAYGNPCIRCGGAGLADEREPVAQGGGVDAEKVMALVEEFGNLRYDAAWDSQAGRYKLAKDSSAKADELHAQIRALLSATPAASGWQPIETAPKDGRLIVVTGHDYGDANMPRHYCIARFESGFFQPVFDDQNDCSELLFLTHWQPLPPPHAIANQEAQDEGR